MPVNGPPSSEWASHTPPSSLSPPGLWQGGGTGLLRKSSGTLLAGESETGDSHLAREGGMGGIPSPSLTLGLMLHSGEEGGRPQ